MEIGRSIDFVFRDPHWIKKVAIGGLLGLVPVLGWLIIGGYYIRVMQRVHEDIDTPLPDWNDLLRDFVRGVKMFIVYSVYVAPLLSLPFYSFHLIRQDEIDAAVLIQITYGMVGMPYMLVIGFLSPVIAGRLAVHDRITAAFDFPAMYREGRRVCIQMLVYVVFVFSLYMLAGVGVFLCIVGASFTMFAAFLIGSHAIGQIRRVIDDPDADPRSVTFRVG